MARWPEATWRPVKNHGGTMARPVAVTLHHAVANGSLYNVFNGSRQASVHFWIAKDGRVEQYVDTNVVAWHGGTSALNNNCISVETEGCGTPPHAEPMTEAMINTFARLMAWANRAHGIPLKLSEAATEPGFNYHRCRGGFATACPCDERLRMRPEILRRAQTGQLGPSGPPITEEDIVAITAALAQNGALHVFVEAKDGRVFYTWQPPNKTAWNGGAPGKSVAGLSLFAPAPK
jgi:hypothetical protein